jgi:hypothetical protein
VLFLQRTLSLLTSRDNLLRRPLHRVEAQGFVVDSGRGARPAPLSGWWVASLSNRPVGSSPRRARALAMSERALACRSIRWVRGSAQPLKARLNRLRPAPTGVCASWGGAAHAKRGRLRGADALSYAQANTAVIAEILCHAEACAAGNGR